MTEMDRYLVVKRTTRENLFLEEIARYTYVTIIKTEMGIITVQQPSITPQPNYDKLNFMQLEKMK